MNRQNYAPCQYAISSLNISSYLGFYSDASCVHLAAGSGTITASFEIFLNQCGMTSSGNTETNGQPNPAGSFVENTVIIQEEQAKPNHYRAHRGTQRDDALVIWAIE
jgi:hypothetical protein